MLTNDVRRTSRRSPGASRNWTPVDAQRELEASVSHLLEMGPFHATKRNTDFESLSSGDNFFSQEFIDAFQAEVAILNPLGCVFIANKAWQARAKMAEPPVGREALVSGGPLDFLSGNRPTGQLIAARVAQILAGELPDATVNFTVRDGALHRRYRLRAAALGKGKLRGAIVVNEDVSEIYDLHRDKRLLTEQLMRSEETERRRIAREMHDSTVQDLVAIGLNLRRLRHLANDPVAQEVLAEVRTILTRTQQDVRTLSYLLHPPLLEEGGLVLALSSLIRGLSSRMQISVEFDTDVSDSRLPIDVEMALYRVAQEALINVHKHASATNAIVRYHRDADCLVLKVEDDGVGIGGPKVQHIGSGVGIQGMRARLQQLGGTLTLSTLKRGTRLKAVIPYGDESD